MGSITEVKAENGATAEASNGAAAPPPSGQAENPANRGRWKWRDQKPHPRQVNRRLDERVKLEQLDLGNVETDLYEKVEDKVTSLKMTHHQKRKIDETHVEVLLRQKSSPSNGILKSFFFRYSGKTFRGIIQFGMHSNSSSLPEERIWKFLIALSYELSKEEGKVGTPERPLSDLGLLSYSGYWTRVLLDIFKKHEGNISIKELSDMTAIKPDDILSTLQNLDLIQYRKGQHVVCADLKVLDRHLKAAGHGGLEVEVSKLIWTPCKEQG
ncbi:hypothetical protein C4D60_Mb10t11390 [Musa balbisiana]|uniref:Histone acetyltransferase n=1 Tax=Musa balbisiana TaxID=52838 RepID=A0A4S8IYT5_MUSBA|nr:hypothetical protein C4D60_Mb10t11390 [Musa balbisiana]